MLIAVLLGYAVCMLLTSMAANNTMAVVFLTLTGFFLPAIHGPFWSLPMEIGFLFMALSAGVSAALAMTLREHKPALVEVPY